MAGAEIRVRSNVVNVKLDSSAGERYIRIKSLSGERDVQSTIIIDASGFRAELGRELGFLNAWNRYGAGAEYECYCDDLDTETWYSWLEVCIRPLDMHGFSQLTRTELE